MFLLDRRGGDGGDDVCWGSGHISTRCCCCCRGGGGCGGRQLFLPLPSPSFSNSLQYIASSPFSSTIPKPPPPPPTPPRGGRLGSLSGRFPAKAPSCRPSEYPFPSPAVSSFFFPWRRKRKKATPETAKLLSAVLTTATAMSLRFTDDDGRGGEDDSGAVAGDGVGDTIAGGGAGKAGVRTEGKVLWMFRCGCAAARGERAAAMRMRRRGRSGHGRGAIAVMRWRWGWGGVGGMEI